MAEQIDIAVDLGVRTGVGLDKVIPDCFAEVAYSFGPYFLGSRRQNFFTCCSKFSTGLLVSIVIPRA